MKKRPGFVGIAKDGELKFGLIMIAVVFTVAFLVAAYNDGKFDKFLSAYAAREERTVEESDYHSTAQNKCEAAGGFYSDGVFGNQCIFH